jgi:hypothetical protein
MAALPCGRGAASFLRWLGALALAAVLGACGGGGGDGTPAAASSSTTTTAGTTSTGTPSAGALPSAPADLPVAANVLPVTLDRGTDGSALNAPFVSVTVCVPGTQNCTTIDHVLVDTGSFGLRVEASALGALGLPAATATGGGALAECASFASGYTWGSVRSADVRLAGQQASALPVQVIDDPAAPYAGVPTACSNTGAPLDAAGSRGILGVGFLVRDCGVACANSALPGQYFSCGPRGGCTGVAVPVSAQVANPAALLAGVHNNGVALVLPAVPAGGARSVAGSLVLGVGTSANNQVGSLGVFAASRSGNFNTTYQGRTSTAFIDSGSNGLFFADNGIALCSSGFYCPSAALSLAATVTGTNGTSRSVPFLVENASALPAGTAAAHLGGSVILGSSFDWGLPFFLGRTVFVAFDGRSTPAGTGPFWAF